MECIESAASCLLPCVVLRGLEDSDYLLDCTHYKMQQPRRAVVFTGRRQRQRIWRLRHTFKVFYCWSSRFLDGISLYSALVGQHGPCTAMPASIRIVSVSSRGISFCLCCSSRICFVSAIYRAFSDKGTRIDGTIEPVDLVVALASRGPEGLYKVASPQVSASSSHSFDALL